MKFIKNIDYKKLIVPAIIIVVFIGSFFFQKYKLNNTDMESIPIQNEEVVLKKDTKLSTIKIDGIDFEFKVDVLEYDLTVSNDIETLNITAITTGGENADIKLGNGNKLLVGNNKITVDVKNSNQVTKYTFNVYRKKVTLSCPSNTTLDGNNCITKNFIQNASIKFSCDASATLEGSICTKIEIKEATTYESCETGYTKVGNNCQKKETKDKVITDFTCPDKNGKEGRFNGSHCVYETTYTAQTTFYCNQGRLNGNICEITEGQTSMIEEEQPCSGDNCTGNIIKRCPSGTEQISGNTCAYINRIPAEERSECLQGGDLISRNTCRKEELAKPSNVKYGCPSGYKTTSSGTCETTLTKDTFKNFSCSKGFTYENGKCIKETVTSAKEILSCPTGLKLDKDTRKCYEELLSLPTKIEEDK